MGTNSFILCAILALLHHTSAVLECPCGYTTGRATFMHALLTDFSHVKAPGQISSVWQLQQWEMPANLQTGVPYRRLADPANVVFGGTDGVKLVVNKTQGNAIRCAEMRTVREDLGFGSYRVGLKGAAVDGTCAALFWYHNDTREIDIELLSSERGGALGDPPAFANYVVHSALQNTENNKAGSINSPNYKKLLLPSDPSAAFHDYRFDWTPTSVEFFVDTVSQGVMMQDIPQEAGRMFLNHWSDGSKSWSGGPPTDDAVVTVAYFQGYFNSSDADKMVVAEKACANAVAKGKGAVCDITGPVVREGHLPNATESDGSAHSHPATRGAAPPGFGHGLDVAWNWVLLLAYAVFLL